MTDCICTMLASTKLSIMLMYNSGVEGVCILLIYILWCRAIILLSCIYHDCVHVDNILSLSPALQRQSPCHQSQFHTLQFSVFNSLTETISKQSPHMLYIRNRNYDDIYITFLCVRVLHTYIKIIIMIVHKNIGHEIIIIIKWLYMKC